MGNGEFALSPEHYAYEGYQAQKAEQSAAFLAGQEEVPGLLGAFNHTCLIPLNRSLVAGNGTLTWYDEQLDGPLGYGSCADSSVLGAVILFLLVVLIATSSRSGGGVASRGVQYKATLPTAPRARSRQRRRFSSSRSGPGERRWSRASGWPRRLTCLVEQQPRASPSLSFLYA